LTEYVNPLKEGGELKLSMTCCHKEWSLSGMLISYSASCFTYSNIILSRMLFEN
jgi:hypothetical protein